MKQRFILLLVATSALGLGACAKLGFADKKPATKETPAQTATYAPATPSAAEQADMERAMGSGLVTAKPKTDIALPTATAAVETPAPVAAAAPAPAPKTEEAKPVTASTTAEPATTGKDACPGVQVLPETRSITYFEDPAQVAMGNEVARASITRIRGGCTYTGNMVEVDIDLLLRGKIGDQGRNPKADADSFMTFPYFVAVSDPQGNLMDKQILATAIKFPPKHADVDAVESVRQKFAVSSPAAGQNYTILVGFQLTKEQLAYNARSTVKPASQPIEAGTKKMQPVMD